MSALLLLMILPLGLTAFRLLSNQGVRRVPALAGSAAAALLLTAPFTYALRTKPSHGSPSAIPSAPAFALPAGSGVALQVEFGAGWSEGTSDASGREIRRMRGQGQLVVGPLGAGRPPAVLAFEASSAPEARLVVSLAGLRLVRTSIRADDTDVRIRVPAGDGPAVLELEVNRADAVLTVPVASLRATARLSR